MNNNLLPILLVLTLGGQNNGCNNITLALVLVLLLSDCPCSGNSGDATTLSL